MEKELEMGTIGEGGCPCGSFSCERYEIQSHCWRTAKCCEFSGVHYKAKNGFSVEARKHAKELADYISDAWRTDCAVSSKPRK